MFESNMNVEDNLNNSLSESDEESQKIKFIWSKDFISHDQMFTYTYGYGMLPNPKRRHLFKELPHLSWSIQLKINFWPEGIKEISFYQFCSLFHIVSYGNSHRTCRLKKDQFCMCFYQKKYFYKPGIDKDVYVLDSVDKDQLFYVKITKEQFINGSNILLFSDKPLDKWEPHWKEDNKRHLLRSIYKIQHFKLFLVGKKENNEFHKFQGWKWSYKMSYSNKEIIHVRKYFHETNEELPIHLINFPNANSCVYKTKPIKVKKNN